MADESKREVFSSLASRFKRSENNKPLFVRPPYNEEESSFHKSCNECEEKPCVTICEEDNYKIDGEKFHF